MRQYRPLKTRGMAVVLTVGMAASATIGYIMGNYTGFNAGYEKGLTVGKIEGKNKLLEKIQDYAPGTIDKVRLRIKDEKLLEDFEKTLDRWIGVDTQTETIEQNFDEWIKK